MVIRLALGLGLFIVLASAPICLVYAFGGF